MLVDLSLHSLLLLAGQFGLDLCHGGVVFNGGLRDQLGVEVARAAVFQGLLCNFDVLHAQLLPWLSPHRLSVESVCASNALLHLLDRVDGLKALP